MRDLNREAWFLYTVTSIEHFERCAQACQDFAQLFDQLMTKHDAHGYANLDYWVKEYYGHAKEIRRLIELVKLGDYLPMRSELNDARASYKGIIEQPLGWMTPDEEKAWEEAFSRLSSLCGMSHEAMYNNEWAGLYWVNREEHKHEQELVDRDDGYVGDYEWYITESQAEGLLPKPNAYPSYIVDKPRPCRAGETCPWTGVWVPEQALTEGLEHFSITFAVAGRPMQPAYRIVADYYETLDDDPEIPSVNHIVKTKAEDAIWYPVVQAEVATTEKPIASAGGRLRAEPKDIVPKTGWWHSPAKPNGQYLHYFEQGQHFPDTHTTSYGSVIWGFDPNEQKDPPQR